MSIKNLDGIKRGKRTTFFCVRCLAKDKKKEKITEDESRFCYVCTKCGAHMPFETNDPLYWSKHACGELMLINKACYDGKQDIECTGCGTKFNNKSSE